MADLSRGDLLVAIIIDALISLIAVFLVGVATLRMVRRQLETFFSKTELHKLELLEKNTRMLEKSVQLLEIIHSKLK